MLYVPEATVELLALVMSVDLIVVEEGLTMLARRGLAKRVPGSDSTVYRVHDLAFSYARVNTRIARDDMIAACRDYVMRHKDEPDALDLERTNVLRAAGSAHQAGDDDSLMKIVYTLTVDGSYFRARGHDFLLLEQMDRAIETARKVGEQDMLHFLLGKRGDAFYDQGNLAQALAHYEESLALARTLTLVNRVVILLCVISKVRADQQDFATAESVLQEAQQLAAQDDMLLGKVLEHRGYVAQSKNDLAEALRVFTEQLQLAQRLNDPERVFFAQLNLGVASMFLDNFDAALLNLQKALEIAQAENNHTWMGLARFAMGGAYHRLDDRANAQTCFDTARDLFRTSGYTAKLNEVEAYMQEENYPL